MSGPDPRGPLADWFRRRLAAPELEIAAIAALSGGLVNHVATVDLRRAPSAAIERLLLRIDPVTGPYAPYDMAEQFDRFVRLEAVDLPVPKPLFLETDRSVIGRDFWVSEFVEGDCFGRLLDLDAPEGEHHLQSFMDALARIHGADWRAAGLDRRCPPLGPPELGATIERAGAPIAGLAASDRAIFEAIRVRLRSSIPADFPMALTHGDCSISNYIFRGGDIVAIVDWDLARISDPVSDLGYYAAIHHRFRMTQPRAARAAALAPVIAAFRARSGADLATLAFWEMFQGFANALSWVRPGWDGQASGFAAYRDRLAELLADD